MAFIETTSATSADPAAKKLLEADEAGMGYLPNYARLLARRPQVYAAWKELLGAIKANMDARRYELVTIAAAQRLRSSYCMLAHSTVMIDALGFEPDTIRDIVADRRTAPIDDAERAVMDLAEQVVADAASVTQTDIERLRAYGLTDAEILDVILAAAARCFLSKTVDAAGVLPDARYAELDAPLRDALIVGRPIETATRP